MTRLAIVLAAPHRLPFLTGALGLVGLAAWWLGQLCAMRFGFPPMPQTTVPPALLHGPAMIYTGLAPFIFGFLLTVFPRWMGQPDLQARSFTPVSVPLAAGMVVLQAGLWFGRDGLVALGFGLAAIGWLVAIGVLGAVLRRNARAQRPPCWHGWSAWTALVLGLAGLLGALAFVLRQDAATLPLANRLGLGGFLLPVFLTVSHRMIPFFAGNVVKAYVIWRPDWLLAALWALLAGRVVAELSAIDGLRLIANAGLAALTALMCWKWWPRAHAPGLFIVLIWGFAWAPVGFTLAMIDQIVRPLGRAPDHALLIGFSGSLLIAMVTRVTQGHSGRPLEMPWVSWLAFAAIQLAAITRLAAAIRLEDSTLLVVSIALFLVGLTPWALRNAAIYISPRRDGKSG